jgi:hypothetical protein
VWSQQFPKPLCLAFPHRRKGNIRFPDKNSPEFVTDLAVSDEDEIRAHVVPLSPKKKPGH